jgi:uncharacterized protein
MDNFDDEFQIFIKPAGSRCNLSCDYCYYRCTDLDVDATVMPKPLLEKYIRQHIELSNSETITFSWHGGEPMLAGLDFYSEVVSLQNRYNRKGRSIINGIQTNGTLIDREWAAFFKEYGFVVGLSIDGPEEYHNSYRKGINGHQSFESVMNGWNLLKEFSVPHELLCVVSITNVDYPAKVYNFFREGGAEYLTFLPLVERVGKSEVTSRSVIPEKFGEFLIDVFEIWKGRDIGSIKIQIIEEALRAAFNQDHTLCVFKSECGGVPVLEMNGDIYTCDHYVNSDNLTGNILNSDLAKILRSDLQVTFGRYKSESLPQFCKKCEVLDMCNGECPRNRFIKTPDGESGLNYLCSGYRLFFNKVRPFANQIAGIWSQNKPG